MGTVVGLTLVVAVVVLGALAVVIGAVIGLSYVLDGQRQARCRQADAARVIIERERYRAAERPVRRHAASPHEQPGRQGKTFPDAALPAGSPPREHVGAHRRDVPASRGASGSDRPESRALRTAA